MFRKLRLKLTLINATIIILLFLLLITGTYYYSREKITRLSDDLAARILYELQTGQLNDLPQAHEMAGKENKPWPPANGNLPDVSDNKPPLKPLHEMIPDKANGKEISPPSILFNNPPGPGPSFFFIKISPEGIISSQSSNLPLNEEKRNELVAAILPNNLAKGEITLGENEYRYTKAVMNTTSDTILLFQDFTRETHMLRIQSTALTVTGLICLILSLLGSFLMAHRAMIPIQQAWQQQKDFLSDASHELRTPLTVIQTNLDIVLDSQEETVASQNKWLQNIQEESTRMAKLVNSLLFLARSDSNQQLLEQAPFSLTQALLETAAAFEPLAQTKQLAIDVSAPADEIVTVGDKDRLKQVLCILLDNAIKHTSAGKITVTLSKEANKLVLAVTDSGEGIAPEHLDKIFDRFYQVDKARSQGGAGLGLAIAKCIIENHKGTIKANSTLGFGTTFTIELPVRQLSGK